MYRFTLERYRGRGSRYVCPQCGRKYSFTRYVDTQTQNYVGDNVGKCNRLDKCGYHYTPRQYFEDHPWLRDSSSLNFQTYRGVEKLKIENHPPRPTPTPHREAVVPSQDAANVLFGLMPRTLVERTLTVDSDYKRWLRTIAGEEATARLVSDYKIGGCYDEATGLDATIFWQEDIAGDIRTGKIMNFDPTTGKRRKGDDALVDWVHSVMRREGALPEGWELRQCLYGEALLARRPGDVVALAEGPKTAHIGSLLMPSMVWLAADSMMSLSQERLQPLAGRSVVLFPDEGRGFKEWSERIVPIAREVGFRYSISDFMERVAPNTGGDIADLVAELR